MFNITDYGAVPDGKTLATKAIQEAVNVCASSGGGTVFIPAGGVFVSGTVHLLSNVHILLENGAQISGSKNIDDFEPIENLTCPEYQDRSHSFFNQSLFIAENCENISITGLGIIDMHSIWQIDTDWRTKNNLVAPKCANPDYSFEEISSKYLKTWYRGAKVIALKNCDNVVVSDLRIKNATDLAVYFAGCENVRITGLNIYSHIDGISPDNSKNVTISDCIVNTGDDAVVPKSSCSSDRFHGCENITISNCIITSRCNAIKFGTESVYGFKNFTISNCTITDTRFSGIAIESVDGAIFDGINISNVVMENVGNPLLMLVLFRGQAPVGTPIGKIQNVILSNITVKGPYKSWQAIPGGYYKDFKPGDTLETKPCLTPFIIAGQHDSMIENITLSNINATLPGGGTEDDRKLVPKEVRCEYPECTIFGSTLPSYGLFARHIKNLKLYNANFKTYEQDSRDAVLIDRVTGYENI